MFPVMLMMYLKFRTITNHTTSQGNCHKSLEVFGHRLVKGDGRPYVGGRHAGPDDFLLRPVAEVLGDKGQKVLARDPDRAEERCSVRGRHDSRHRSDEPDLGMSIQLLEACLGPTEPDAAYLHVLYNLYDFTLKLSCFKLYILRIQWPCW